MKSILFVCFSLFLVFQLQTVFATSGSNEDAKSPEASTTTITTVSGSTEEKPVVPTEGPHKGRLVAAGSFQLEILWESDFSAKIYLLDSDYKNETVQGSEVGVFFVSGNVESEMSCQPAENYFECKQGSKKFKKGELSISAKRNGVQAEEVKVKVPFENRVDAKDAKADTKAKKIKAPKK